MSIIDARGLSCPQPVLLTQKALKDSPAEISVLVDNTTARNNVQRFAQNAGYQVEISAIDGEYRLDISK